MSADCKTIAICVKERLTAAFLNLYFEVRSIETGSHVTRVYDGDVSLMKAGRDKTVLLGGVKSYDIIK